MKIICEHCGSAIDLNKDRVCPGCKAPYDKNKEYIKLKERGEKFFQEVEQNKETAKKTTKIVLIIFGIFFGTIVIEGILTFVIGFGIFGKIFGLIKNDIEKTNNEFELIEEKEDFNDNFEVFKNQSMGYDKTTLITLINTIIQSDNLNENHIIYIYYNNTIYTTTDEKEDLISSLDSDGLYEIDFSNDNDGFINKITITRTN